MATPSYLIKSILHKSLAEGVFRDIQTKKSNYYYVLGKTLPWNVDDDPPYPIDSYRYERETRSEAITYKLISPSDVAFTTRRIDWISGTVYDMYDDKYGGELIGAEVTDGGSGYTALPTIEITGGGGSGAWITAVVDTGIQKVIGATLQTPGSGYTQIPTLTISGGNGSGAVIKPIMAIGKNGAIKLEETDFYVLTDDYNVYKCLDNNNGAKSVFKPAGTQTNPILTPDGYVWKYMYNIPIGLRNKFLTNDQMPVISALSNQFYSNGQLDAITIDNKGANYTSASIVVDGDGYRERDPLYIQSVIIDDGGTDYTSNSTVTFSDPFTDSSLFVPGTNVSVGQKIYTSNKDFYKVVGPGLLGGYEATHTAGQVRSNGYIGTLWQPNTFITAGEQVYYSTNLYQCVSEGTTSGTPPTTTDTDPFTDGDATLRYVKPTPKGTAVLEYIGSTAKATLSIGGAGEITSVNLIGSIREINVVSAGDGYTKTPSVNVTGGGGVHARAVAKMNQDSVLYTQIMDEGYGYTSAPTITFGQVWTENGIVYITDQVYYSNNLYTISDAETPLRISLSYYQANNKSISTEETSPSGLYFSPSGSRMYLVGSAGDAVNEYSLSTAWKIPTCSFVDSFDISSDESNATGVFLSPDGVNLYVIGGTAVLRSYTLSTPWDITTASSDNTFDVSTQDSDPQDIYFSDDGTKFYIAGHATDKIYQYTMTTAWDISTASYDASFNIASQSGNPTDICFSYDGSYMVVSDSSSKTLYQYNLSSVWDVTSAVYADSYSVQDEDESVRGVWLKPDNSKMWIIGDQNDTVYEYNVALVSYLGTVAPTHTTGSVVSGDATLTWAGHPATAEATLKYGSGYAAAPSITVTGGTGFEYALRTSKSNAKLIPVIENGQIGSVQIEDGGVGYTYADLTVLSTSGQGATLSANLSIGNIQSLQANNEILSTDGAIDAIPIISRGYGYGSADVIIVGDGQDALAEAVIDPANGSITKINVLQRGYGYTFASVIIHGNGYAATARPILGPVGGHGKNSPDELFSRTLTFYSNLSSDLNQGMTVNNDYRQVGIIKNPNQFNSTNKFTGTLGSGCYLIESTIDTDLFEKDQDVYINRGVSWAANTEYTVNEQIYYGNNLYLVTQEGTTSSNPPNHTFGVLSNGDVILLYIGSPRRKYRIVSINSSTALLQSLDNDVPTVSDNILNNDNNSFKPKSVTYPTVDKYSGQLMYIDNKAGFTPSDNETVTLRTVIKF